MCRTITIEKYGDPGNLVVTAHIKNNIVENTLTDQGEAMNMMTTMTIKNATII
jgi:hypothetical protein